MEPLYWPKDMYAFFRSILGPKFFDYMARDENFFMLVGAMDKAVMPHLWPMCWPISPEKT